MLGVCFDTRRNAEASSEQNRRTLRLGNISTEAKPGSNVPTDLVPELVAPHDVRIEEHDIGARSTQFSKYCRLPGTTRSADNEKRLSVNRLVVPTLRTDDRGFC